MKVAKVNCENVKSLSTSVLGGFLYSSTVKYLGAEKFSFSSWSNLQKFLHSDWTELYRLSRPWLVSKTFPKFLSKAKLLITLFSPSLPVHKKRMPRASPLQERLLLTMTHFCSTLPKFGKSSTLGRAYWTRGTWGGDGDFNMRANLFYWDNALSIPFYRAGVYWIYILSIHPGCLRGNFQYTPALEKRMAIHCLELGWIGKYAPWGNFHLEARKIRGPRGANCRRGRNFQFIPTRGSVLPFFFPERECIGNYTPQ